MKNQGLQLVPVVKKGTSATEYYITAGFKPGQKCDVGLLFGQLASVIKDLDAEILHERIFGTDQALETALRSRAQVFPDTSDLPEPTKLLVPKGLCGELAGVQIRAVSGLGKMGTIRYNDQPCGRIYRGLSSSFLTISSVLPDSPGDNELQARQMFDKIIDILNVSGTDMRSVPRTWMWLGNILEWYDNFNSVRNDFFKKCGLIGNGSTNCMPASTGIGIGPVGSFSCCADLDALAGSVSPVEYFDAGGNQQSAFEYGSAFSRAAAADSPAGKTVYISGTASIDADGKTIFKGDASAQIAQTIENVRTLFAQLKCSDEDVVTALIYCKTPEVEKLFWDKFSDIPWPFITAITDVCRDDLLFEIEATALLSR